MRIGLVALAGALVFALFLMRTGASPTYRALGFVPFFFQSHVVVLRLAVTAGQVVALALVDWADVLVALSYAATVYE